jgi:hypothetical protein
MRLLLALEELRLDLRSLLQSAHRHAPSLTKDASPAPRDEPCLLQGCPGGPQWTLALTGWVLLLLLILFEAANPMSGPWETAPLIALIGGMSLLSLHLLGTGTFRLTPSRLEWRPLFGRRVAVSLSSIIEGGVDFEGGSSVRVHLEGQRTVYIQNVEHAGFLAFMLQAMRRHPRLRECADAGKALANVVYCEAVLSQGASEVRGYAILRPGSVTFLPWNAAIPALQALFGVTLSPQFAINLPSLVKGLRLFPKAFDEQLAQLTEAVGGIQWSRTELWYRIPSPMWIMLWRKGSGDRMLVGRVSTHEHDVIQRILVMWSRQSSRRGPP